MIIVPSRRRSPSVSSGTHSLYVLMTIYHYITRGFCVDRRILNEVLDYMSGSNGYHRSVLRGTSRGFRSSLFSDLTHMGLISHNGRSYVLTDKGLKTLFDGRVRQSDYNRFMSTVRNR